MIDSCETISAGGANKQGTFLAEARIYVKKSGGVQIHVLSIVPRVIYHLNFAREDVILS